MGNKVEQQHMQDLNLIASNGSVCRVRFYTTLSIDFGVSGFRSTLHHSNLQSFRIEIIVKRDRGCHSVAQGFSRH